MLNIEAVCDDLILYLKQRFPPALAAVVARSGDTRIPVSPPQASSYYLGEYSRIRSYRLPACFVVPSRSTPMPSETIDKWQQEILLDFLVEGSEEDQLTRACFRMAEAAYDCLHDRDITRAGVATRSSVVQRPTIDYGPMIAKTPEGRPFRKDVFLTLRIIHYDQATPVG